VTPSGGRKEDCCDRDGLRGIEVDVYQPSGRLAKQETDILKS